LKRRHPELAIIINGGIASLDEAEAQLAHVDGVMLGRAAYHTPWILHDVDGGSMAMPPRPPAQRTSSRP